MNARRQILLVQMEVQTLHGIDERHTGIAHPTPLVSMFPPHVHLYQAISHLLRLIGTILPVVQSLLSSLCAGKINAHFRADAGARSGSAGPRIMPRMPRRKR